MPLPSFEAFAVGLPAAPVVVATAAITACAADAVVAGAVAGVVTGAFVASVVPVVPVEASPVTSVLARLGRCVPPFVLVLSACLASPPLLLEPLAWFAPAADCSFVLADGCAGLAADEGLGSEGFEPEAPGAGLAWGLAPPVLSASSRAENGLWPSLPGAPGAVLRSGCWKLCA
ncbi:MAG: hypothetical protein ACLPKB_13065 [Xanthobacteraceae bacterium]